MRETLFVSFNLGEKRLSTTRTLLAKTGLAEVAELCQEGDFSPGYCSVTVAAGDPRIEELKEELAKIGESVSIRLDREYTEREIDQYPWLRLMIITAGLLGGANYQQPYDRSTACRTCGAGAEPVGALIAQLSRMGRKQIDCTAHDGHMVVTAELAEAVREAGLTGICVMPVRRNHKQDPDPEYAWLKVVSEWPAMLPTRVLDTEDLCPDCGRTGHFDPYDRAAEWRYRKAPKTARDFNHTWERFGVWKGGAFSRDRPPVGGSAGIIVSQRVRRVFKLAGVRRIRYDPVYVEEISGS